MTKKIALSLDDFTIVHNRLDLLLKLKNHFPDFKVSLFTIPMDTKMDYGPYLERGEALQEVKKHLDWIQLIPHGLLHDSSSEMVRESYDSFKNTVIPSIKKAFEEDGLPYEHGFKAPHWRWSEGVAHALDDLGFWGAVRPEKGKMLRTKKFYEHTHGLDEPFWESELETLKLHGHIYGTKNGLGLCFNNLLKLPRSVEWHFVTDFLEEQDDPIRNSGDQ